VGFQNICITAEAAVPDASDPFDLQRFLVAQEPVYPAVVAELRGGAKRTHWMWFIFPQFAGLGSSGTARHYAIRSTDEARAYDQHPILGQRLHQCFRLVLASGTRVSEIFPHPDHLKYHSCATLFAAAVPEQPLYGAALASGFSGERDAQTLRLLRP
jgi:uncharacterized protein (DUF1810 family)